MNAYLAHSRLVDDNIPKLNIVGNDKEAGLSQYSKLYRVGVCWESQIIGAELQTDIVSARIEAKGMKINVAYHRLTRVYSSCLVFEADIVVIRLNRPNQWDITIVLNFYGACYGAVHREGVNKHCWQNHEIRRTDLSNHLSRKTFIFAIHRSNAVSVNAIFQVQISVGKQVACANQGIVSVDIVTIRNGAHRSV